MTYPDPALIDRLGRIISDAAPGGPRVLYLYVEASSAVCEPSLYQEFDSHALFINLDWELFGLVFELWQIADDKNKWGTMIFDLRSDKFTLHFDYEPRLDVEDDDHDYREDALMTRFGVKRIVYPPIDLDEERRKAFAAGGNAFDL